MDTKCAVWVNVKKKKNHKHVMSDKSTSSISAHSFFQLNPYSPGSSIYTLVFTTTNWRSFFTRIKCPSSVCFTVRTVFLELHSSPVQNIFFKRKFLKDYLQLFGFQSHTFLFFIFILVVFTNILLKLKCSFSVFIFVLLHK